MKFIIYTILFFISPTLFSQNTIETIKELKIIAEMIDSVKTLKTATYNMKGYERLEKGFKLSNISVKLQENPRKVYLKNHDKNIEVLYNSINNKNKALVKPNEFPYISIWLDPTGSLMRKSDHFTINELGFTYTVKVITIAISKNKNDIAKHLSHEQKQLKNGFTCYRMVYENPNFGYTNYVVLAKETVSSISKKLLVNEYMVRLKNKLVDEYGFVKEGTQLQVPTFYCKKAIFYIDEKTMLPISTTVYDEFGIFENYEYSDIIKNKLIPDAEFEKNFKGYHF